MKRIYVNEKWCLGCHLCEYHCAFANTEQTDIVRALKDVAINPRIRIEEHGGISFAVSCRHCHEPLCVKGCITGALTVKSIGGDSDAQYIIAIDKDRCVSCYTCIMSCPFGAVCASDDGAVQKCELCIRAFDSSDAGAITQKGVPACVKGCPNGAIVYEERG